jgi:enediyne biosynthesis protein E4
MREKSLIDEIRAEPEEDPNDGEPNRSRCPEARIPSATTAMSPRRPSGPGSCLRIAVTLSAVVLGISCRPAHRLDSPAGTPEGRRSAPDSGPKPVSLALKVAEPARDRPEPSPIRFREVTERTGIDFVHVSGNSPLKYYPTANGSGVALLDYDGDGRLDIYFATTRNFPLSAPTTSGGNELYRNRGDGTFEDVTARAGVGYRGFCHGVAVADVDNDGDPDLFLANFGPDVLYLNDGHGHFRQAEGFLRGGGPSWSSGAAFLDYDGDGRLDLYITCYGEWTLEGAHPYCGDEARGIRTYCSPRQMTPVRHYLYRNRGDGTFEDATAKAGILRRDGRGLGVVAADVNLDGRIDLYIANDMCGNFLFLNRGDGTFEDVSNTSGAAATEAGYLQASMGVDAEDVNGDGLPELFVTNFEDDYNTLYRNLDGRNFQDVSASAGIVKDSLPYVGWGCALADLDNDGLPDMFVVNGHVDDNLAQLGRPTPQAEPAMVWRNQFAGRFRLVRDPGPYFATRHVARGAAFGDLDNDGDIDVVISRMDGRPAVLLNESESGRWLGLELVGTRSNRSAIGALIAVGAGGRVLHRQVKGGGSYISANDPRVLVGVGAADRVEEVEIRWPSGSRSKVAGLALGRYHRIVEPEGDRTGRGGEGR